jgi:hypothetical protein
MIDMEQANFFAISLFAGLSMKLNTIMGLLNCLKYWAGMSLYSIYNKTFKLERNPVLVVPSSMYIVDGSMQSCSWLRHYARRQKVVGSIPDEVIGFFN